MHPAYKYLVSNDGAEITDRDILDFNKKLFANEGGLLPDGSKFDVEKGLLSLRVDGNNKVWYRATSAAKAQLGYSTSRTDVVWALDLFREFKKTLHHMGIRFL